MSKPKPTILSNFFGLFDNLSKLKSKEGDLLKRKRNGRVGGTLAILAIIFEIIKEASNLGLIEYFEILGRRIWMFFTLDWDRLLKNLGDIDTYEIWGIIFIVLGFGSYLLLRRSGFLMKDIKEPFQYTIHVREFVNLLAGGENDKSGLNLKKRYQLDLIAKDLTERLNMRINRFSLSPTSSDEDESIIINSSHIEISGNYSIRQRSDNDWFVHIIPEIRIGPQTEASHLANPIWFNLPPIAGGNGQLLRDLEPEQYRQLLEELYSSVATEIYRQIERDVDSKIKLYPTSYHRAVALYYEALDFAQSNTIDSYDLAIKAYDRSLKYFRTSFALIWAKFVLTLPYFWKYRISFFQTYARCHIGYVNAKVFRDIFSIMFGRQSVSVYDALPLMEEIIERLNDVHLKYTKRYTKDNLNRLLGYLRFPKDSWWRKTFNEITEDKFRNQRHLLFDAYVSKALLLFSLKIHRKARSELNRASSVDPNLTITDPYFILVSGMLEVDLVKKISSFRRVVELDPKFQLAQWNLAKSMENKMRKENQLDDANIERCIEEYDNVLQLNQGNISALYSKGFLYWIQKEFSKAIKIFKAGIDVKTINKETFIGNLYYGLSRAYLSKVVEQNSKKKGSSVSESDDFKKAHTSFLKAIESHPSVGAYTFSVDKIENFNVDFDFISKELLDRYQEYYSNTLKVFIDEKIENHALEAFVRNDYANACLNIFHRFGIQKHLESAIEEYELCKQIKPDFSAVYFNLDNAFFWSGELEKRKPNISQGIEYAFGWADLMSSFFNSNIFIGINKKRKIKQFETDILDLENKLRSTNPKREGSSVAEWVDKSAAPPSSQFHLSQDLEDHEIKNRNIKSKEEKEDQLSELKSELFRIDNYIEKTFKDIFNSTSLSSLVIGQSIELKRIKELPKVVHLDNKLDASDLSALIVCAEYALYNENKKVARIICETINKIAVSDFDANLRLYELNVEDKKTINELKAAFSSWFDEDPSSYSSLKWVIDFYPRIFSNNEKIDFLDKALRSLPEYNGGNGKFNKPYIELLLHLAEDMEGEEDARILYEKIMNEAPTEFDYYDSYAQYLIESDSIEEAISVLENGKIHIVDKSYEFYMSLGSLYHSSGNNEYALNNYKQAHDLNNSIRTREALIELYTELGDFEKADGYYEEIENEDRKLKVDLHANTVGNIFFKNKLYDKARRYYRLARQINNKEPVYYENLGLCDEREGKVEEAISMYNEGIEKADDEYKDSLYNRMGILYYNKGEHEIAMDYYSQALEIRKWEAYYYNMGLALEGLGQVEEAIGFFTQALDFPSENAKDVYTNKLGLIYLNLKNYQLAANYFKESINLYPQYAIYYDNLGLVYERMNNLKEAEKTYKLAISSEKVDQKHRLYNCLGNLRFAEKKYAEAAEFYKQAVKEELNPIYYENLGRSYDLINNQEEAIRAFKTCLIYTPEDQKHRVLHRLGSSKYKLKMFEEAAKDFKEAISLHKNILYIENLGHANYGLGQLEEADKNFNECLNMAAEADKHFFLFKRGQIKYYEGKYDETISFIESAISSFKDPLYFEYKGKALLKLDHPKEAEIAYDNAIKHSNTSVLKKEMKDIKQFDMKNIKPDEQK